MLENITTQLKAGATTVQVEKAMDYAAVLALFDELHLQHPETSCFRPYSYTKGQASTQIRVRTYRQLECTGAVERIAEISGGQGHLHTKYYALLALFTQHDPDRVLCYPGGNHYTIALAVKYLFSLEGIDARVIKARKGASELYVVDSCYSGRRKLTIPYLDSYLCGCAGAGGLRYFLLGAFINDHIKNGWISFYIAHEFEGRSFFEKKAAVVSSQTLEEFEGPASGFTNAFALSPMAMAGGNEISARLSNWAVGRAFAYGWFFDISSHTISEFFLTLNGKKSPALCITGSLPELTEKYCECAGELPLLVAAETDRDAIGQLTSAYQAQYYVPLAVQYYTQCGFAVCRASRKQGERYKRVCQLIPGAYRWYAQFLTVYQREASNAIIDAVYQTRAEVFVPTALGLTPDDVSCVFDILRLDYPELFYLSAVEVVSDGKCVFSIKLGRQDKQAAANKQKLLFVTARALLSEWEQSDQPMRLCFQQFLDHNVAYCDATGSDADSDLLNAAGCLLGKKCACRGIADAFQLLSGLAGQKSVVVTGIGNGGPHAWNMAKIDDQWCNIDFTWNLSTKSYLFMCCPDEHFPGHTAQRKFAYPKCQSMRHYYYAAARQLIMAGSDQEQTEQSVEACIAEQMRQGRREIVLNIKNCDVHGFAQQHLNAILGSAIKKSGREVKVNSISVHMREILRINIGFAERAIN